MNCRLRDSKSMNKIFFWNRSIHFKKPLNFCVYSHDLQVEQWFPEIHQTSQLKWIRLDLVFIFFKGFPAKNFVTSSMFYDLALSGKCSAAQVFYSLINSPANIYGNSIYLEPSTSKSSLIKRHSTVKWFLIRQIWSVIKSVLNATMETYFETQEEFKKAITKINQNSKYPSKHHDFSNPHNYTHQNRAIKIHSVIFP